VYPPTGKPPVGGGERTSMNNQFKIIVITSYEKIVVVITGWRYEVKTPRTGRSR
jgi:hypothetical protein